MRRIFSFNFQNRTSSRLVSAGLLLIALGLAITLQPLVGAADDPSAFSVRPEVSDLLMFGKKISTDRPLRAMASQPELKPGFGPIMPTRLRVPAAGIDADVDEIGVRNGNTDVPDNIWNVGWLTTSPRPGDVGNSVLDGHKDSVRGTAVFWNLHQLKPGDLIYVSDASGAELAFEVTQIQSYDLVSAPYSSIFGPTSERQLNLITCDGTFIPEQHSYDKRLVVYTHLVSSLQGNDSSRLVKD